VAENADHTLRSPNGVDEWRVYHAIRRTVLFESRGLHGVYDENRPGESEENNYPMVLFHKGTPVGVIRVDIQTSTAWFRRVAVREDLQRAGHGTVLLRLAEEFSRLKGCREVRSNVAPDAVAFYERCGYLREFPNVATTDAVPMRKKLP
jgi:GNAT superfamily N-acetyltransferase